jgi:hypothetical protein
MLFWLIMLLCTWVGQATLDLGQYQTGKQSTEAYAADVNSNLVMQEFRYHGPRFRTYGLYGG